MEEMNAIAKLQQDIGNHIDKLIANFKKDSSSRKTAEYIRERKDKLRDLLENAEKNHQEARALNMGTHNYFTTKFYDQIRDAGEEMNKLLGVVQASQRTPISTVIDDKIDAAKSNPNDDNQVRRLKWQKQKIKCLNDELTSIKNNIELNQSKIYFQHQKEIINDEWKVVKRLDEEINLAENQFQDEYFGESQIFMIKQKVNEVLLDLSEKINRLELTSKTQILLPQVKIPSYDGKYEDWNTFNDTFQRVVHMNSQLSNIEKMQYLKTHLYGEAKKCVQHLSITDGNYDDAWKILQSRYNNKRLIANKLLDKILDLPTSKYESAERIKQLHDTVDECVKALTNLGINTDTWGPMISRILTRKLDNDTNKLYELSIKSPHEIQDYTTMMEFLTLRFQSLEAIQENKSLQKINHNNYNTDKCNCCNQEKHQLLFCQKFKAMDVVERNKFVRDNKICVNCLKHNSNDTCKSSESCKTCKKRHHTMLHRDFSNKQGLQKSTAHTSSMENPPPKDVTNNVEKDVLLTTAIIYATTASGTQEQLRALIDPGSQFSFITENAAQLLELSRMRIHATISGIGGNEFETSKTKLSVKISPRFPSMFNTTAELIVLSKLTSTLPRSRMEDVTDEWKNKNLADPTFNLPGPIDVILGADKVGDLMMEGSFKTLNGMFAQNTQLGWILSGISSKYLPTQKLQVTTMISRSEEDKQLTKFWQIEEVENKKIESEEDKHCEAYYKATTFRNTDGRYTVRIPFKECKEELGTSRPRALARLLQLEKKLNNNDELKQRYHSFMKEYIDMGHMALVDLTQSTTEVYHIPHQAVIKEDSTTTKLRVVFDASCKSSSGVSLNQKMCIGPRLQQDIADILLRWRTHCVAFTADIEKMYRQVKLHEDDQDLHRILWRFDTCQPILEYKLKTITYGTASAPYLAIRTIHQLADDEKHNYPLASQATMTDFYVDDVLSGANTKEDALILQKELIQLMNSGGLTLRKWSSNNISLLEAVPPSMRYQESMEIDEETSQKSLGIYWNPMEDVFHFKVNISTSEEKEAATKRKILSDISKLYDPLGWLSPAIITAKIIIQKLWIKEIEWDSTLPREIQEAWESFRSQLKAVEQIKIPRWINFDETKGLLELHGFCDSSEAAYGAVIYCRTETCKDKSKVSLLWSKSKVAPLKMRKTLPRLELCAAHLLAKMLERIQSTLKLKSIPVYAWTDSTITLAWIKGSPDRWKTFVANRVAEINERLSTECWNHVPTKENPADLVSRGIDPEKLLHCELWWNGPWWLVNKENWPCPTRTNPTNIEAKICLQTQIKINANFQEIVDRFSSFNKMLRVIGYCLRFMYNINGHEKKTGTLTVEEMNKSLSVVVKRTQQELFQHDYNSLSEGGAVNRKSKILSLNPFVDSCGIIRVGGRIKNASIAFNEKHPMIIPKDSRLAYLILQHAHNMTLHGGNQISLAYSRRRFWIVNGKQLIKKIINRCPTCIRYKGESATQLMGNLPAPRVTESPPFSHTGVDYAGPIQLRMSKGRGTKSYKGYLAIFVCLVTKAIHIEPVSDMTADTFLAAFRRFISRRGICTNMYSDNGTTFVGAQKYICNEIQEIISQDKVQNTVATLGTKWHFIPPLAPHFGGLWESAVKAMKHHLKRVIGEATLTYEEMATLTQQIEACLNSRPLWPLSNDPDDTTALTPGHFLTGRALLSPTDPVSTDIVIDGKTRWTLVQKIKKDFWKSWSSYYLHELQQRRKWKTQVPNMKVGDLCILKEDNIAPSRWPLGRIAEVHPADENLVRVVTVQDANKKRFKRPISKIVPLSINDNTNSQNEEDDKSRRTINQMKIPIMLTILVGLFCISKVHCSYNIHQLNHGFYVEDIGSACLNRGSFQLQQEVQISQFKRDYENVNKTIVQMDNLCQEAQKMEKTIHCYDLLHHLKEQQNELQWSIQSISDTITNRKKRGLLGKLLTAVFGVNDDVYQDIDKLDQNQQKLIQTSTHQTKIMLSALSAFNDTEIRIEKKLLRFTTKMNQGLAAINRMKSWYIMVDENSLSIHVLTAYQLATNYIQELQTHYNKLLDVQYHRGHIYEFISPAQAEVQLSKASKKLPATLQILRTPILTTHIKRYETKLKICADFIITEHRRFSLMKVTPTPLRIEAKFYWISSVSTEFLSVDFNSQAYFEAEQSELQYVSNGTYILSPSVVRSISDSPSCIVDELYNRMEKATCPVQRYGIETLIWKKLFMANTWMFITNHPASVAITCSGIRKEELLNGTGILKVTPDCVISTKQNTLTPQIHESFPVLGTLFKSVKIPSKISMHSHEEFQSIPLEPVLESTNHLGNLRAAEESLRTSIQETTWSHVKHHTTIISVATTVIMMTTALLTIFLIYKCRTSRQRRQTSRRRPHNNSHEEFKMIPIHSSRFSLDTSTQA